jgi:hypothetical protein
VKRYWRCPCGTRNERIKQKCETCRRARPKRRVPKHAHTLRDDGYAVYERRTDEELERDVQRAFDERFDSEPDSP